MPKSKSSTTTFEFLSKTESASDIFRTSLAGPAKRSSHIHFVETPEEVLEKDAKKDSGPAHLSPLAKSIINVLNGPKDSLERLAFEVDPALVNQVGGLYHAKLRLLPDQVLKRISIQDDLVAAIVRARENQMSAFGRPRPDRFSTGYIIEPNAGVVDKMEDAQKQELDKRIENAVKILESCGPEKGWDDEDRCTFSQYLRVSTRYAIVLGRIATEIIWVHDVLTNKKKFAGFRAIDAGTIYKAAPQQEAAEAVRAQAAKLIEDLKNKRLKKEKEAPKDEDLTWVQVIDGRPLQAFTRDECVVYNFFPCADIELNGYPVTPLDTVIRAVTTHLNITRHNEIYFQTGRAARGMLVIKSDEADEKVVAHVKHQFNASINSVNNAHRMPVFSVGLGDEISWVPIDNSGRDMEFQYLTDMNARVILSAFQISPDELPGWTYLSRGTNNQALSESNNEYKMQAARDLGIRPLIANFEDFLNNTIFPLIDPELAKLCRIKLQGLEAETAEKESIRLQQDMPVHGTYDWVLEKVEKKPVGRAMGGEFPLNPQFQAILDKYYTVGQILEFFMGVKDASKDPSLGYIRDPFWFQWQQLQMQQQQMAQQAQMQQAQAQQAAMGGGAPGSESPEASGASDTDEANGDDGGGGEGGGLEGATEKQKTDAVDDASGQADLARSIDQALASLTKSEKQLPVSKRKILARHRKVLDGFMKAWEEEQEKALKDILDATEHHGGE